VVALFDQIEAEQTQPDNASREILRHLLAALMLHIGRLTSDDDSGHHGRGGDLYGRFRVELERRYTESRRAEDYAARLGCTVKTLTRASLASTGHSAKHVIDARVVLEAQRMLAHTETPISAVARQLGFSEQSNFGKFFLQHTGATPAGFRRSHRPGT
jgi:AraC-like DNA-binding protein